MHWDTFRNALTIQWLNGKTSYISGGTNTLLAGNGVTGTSTGNGGPATSASFTIPRAMAVE